MMTFPQLLFYLVDGTGLALGCFVMLAAIVLRWCWSGRLAAVLGSVLAVVAGASIAASATPLASWLYWVGGIILGTWLVADAARSRLNVKLAASLRSFAVLVVIVWFVVEIPFGRLPALPAAKFPLLQVVGDSVSAGIGRRDEMTWPRCLHRDHGVDVVNLAYAGARLADALAQARQLEPGRSVVLLEIGGNDMLATRPAPPQRYAADLADLLQEVVSPDRLVVMFELPTLPFASEYVRIQRRLAQRHDVALIPKRYFLDVIRVPANTRDGVHLSDRGHQVMADLVWRVIGPVLEEYPDESR